LIFLFDLILSTWTPLEVIGRLLDNGLVLNVAKCVLGQAEVEFLEHSVSTPLPSRVEHCNPFLSQLQFSSCRPFSAYLIFTTVLCRPPTSLSAHCVAVSKGQQRCRSFFGSQGCLSSGGPPGSSGIGRRHFCGDRCLLDTFGHFLPAGSWQP
jgi:hypothetical protein